MNDLKSTDFNDRDRVGCWFKWYQFALCFCDPGVQAQYAGEMDELVGKLLAMEGLYGC